MSETSSEITLEKIQNFLEELKTLNQNAKTKKQKNHVTKIMGELYTGLVRIDYKSSLKMSKLSAIERNPHWDIPMTSSFKLVYLNFFDSSVQNEITRLTTLFFHSKKYSSVRLVGVYRVQNTETFSRFYQKKYEIFDERVDEVCKTLAKEAEEKGINKVETSEKEIVNERWFFHGTKDRYAQIIVKEGFDVRCSGNNRESLYGKGVYLTNYSWIAMHYCTPETPSTVKIVDPPEEDVQPVRKKIKVEEVENKEENKEENKDDPYKKYLLETRQEKKSCVYTMILSRVLLGKVAPARYSQVRPPTSCHSTVDNLQKPTIYVIHDSSQIYPAYIIQFTVNKSELDRH